MEYEPERRSEAWLDVYKRQQGTVEASEVYNVTIKQTRKVSSVLVKTGQEINVGDTLFVLEAEDSDELKQAETDLETLQQNYDKSLIEAGNTAAQENRDVQNARDDYNEALAIYRQYSTMDLSLIHICGRRRAGYPAYLPDLVGDGRLYRVGGRDGRGGGRVGLAADVYKRQSPDGADQARVGRILLQLLAQVHNMHHHGIV